MGFQEIRQSLNWLPVPILYIERGFTLKAVKIYILILVIALITGCAADGVKNTDPTATPAATTEGSTPVVEATPEPSPTPKLPLSGLKICIDPGHQGKNNNDLEPLAPWSDQMKKKVTSGTEGRTIKIAEYVVNLQISQKLKEKLVAQGASVLMIRENHNVDISNKERAEMANEFGAHLTLRIHCNGNDNTSINGIEIYMRDKGDGSAQHNTLASLEFQIASELMNALVEATGANNRNVRKSDEYTGINWSTGPCLIIECGYLTNDTEELLLVSEEYQDKIAQGIVNFISATNLLKY